MIVYESVTMPLWTTGEANLKKGSPHRQPSSEIGYKSRWHSSWKAWSPLVIPWAGWPYNVLTMAHPRVYINVYTDYTYIYISVYIYIWSMNTWHYPSLLFKMYQHPQLIQGTSSSRTVAISPQLARQRVNPCRSLLGSVQSTWSRKRTSSRTLLNQASPFRVCLKYIIIPNCWAWDILNNYWLAGTWLAMRWKSLCLWHPFLATLRSSGSDPSAWRLNPPSKNLEITPSRKKVAETIQGSPVICCILFILVIYPFSHNCSISLLKSPLMAALFLVLISV